MNNIPGFEANVPLGNQLTEGNLNRLAGGIKARTIYSGNGTLVTQTGSGTIVTTRKSRRPPTKLNRFEIVGISEDEDGVEGVRVAPGVVNFVAVQSLNPFVENESKRVIRGIYPTVAGVRIDDESNPVLPIGDRTDATVWVVCDTFNCDGYATAEVVMVGRGEEPDTAGGGEKTCTLIAEFDIVDNDGSKSLENITTYLQSDWLQAYICEDNQGDSSGDSSFNPPDDTSGSGASGSGGGGGGSSGSGGGGGGGSGSGSGSGTSSAQECGMTMKCRWENSVSSFPRKAGTAVADCVPASFEFVIYCQFFPESGWASSKCPRYAFGVSCSGGKPTDPNAATISGDEYLWANSNHKTLRFKVDNPPACGYLELNYRFKAFEKTNGSNTPTKGSEANKQTPTKASTSNGGTVGTPGGTGTIGTAQGSGTVGTPNPVGGTVGTPKPEGSTIDQKCCGQETGGNSVMLYYDYSAGGYIKKLPPVAGCSCSSA